MTVSYWVMRCIAITDPGGGRHPLKLSTITYYSLKSFERLLADGVVVQMPDGCIAEPVECFDDELRAHEHKQSLSARFRGVEDFRVIMAVDAL